jgi:hypothetical protein
VTVSSKFSSVSAMVLTVAPYDPHRLLGKSQVT